VKKLHQVVASKRPAPTVGLLIVRVLGDGFSNLVVAQLGVMLVPVPLHLLEQVVIRSGREVNVVVRWMFAVHSSH
jgi:hypothetical protein